MVEGQLEARLFDSQGCLELSWFRPENLRSQDTCQPWGSGVTQLKLKQRWAGVPLKFVEWLI